MAKRKISAKEAVADIRSGMSDSVVMKKFGLSEEGLQSLYDKLVHAGFIDLSEVEGRLPGYLGTVVISESAVGRVRAEDKYGHQLPKSKPAPVINAQGAARDVRSRMDDSALMQKYRLTPKGLQSLFDKLLAAGLITRIDMDRRTLGFDHTVDLRELTLDFGDALAQLGLDGRKPPTGVTEARPQPPTENTVVHDSLPRAASPDRTDEKRREAAHWGAATFETRWYNKAFIVLLLLIGLFPLGLYALYRNSTFSAGIKALILVAWVALAITCLVLLSGKILPWLGLG